MASGWSIRHDGENERLEDRAVALVRGLIRDGSLSPGEQLPSEPQLARRLGISRPTLRAAIAELVADRLLVRRKGVGTFVAANPPHVSQGLERLIGTGASIRQLGREPGTVGLEIGTEAATEEIADDVQVEVGAPVVHIRRTRTADDRPVVHCEEWVPIDLLPSPDALSSLGPDDSLYQALRDIGLHVRQAVTRFVAVLPDEEVRRRLAVRPREPVLLLEQRHYVGTDIDRVVLLSKNFYNTALIDLHLIRRD